MELCGFLLCFLCEYLFREWCGVIIVVVFYLYSFCGGGSCTILVACVGLMAGGLPVAAVGSVPTVFVGWDVGWDVGLVCRVLCILAFSVPFICACLSRFESY